MCVLRLSRYHGSVHVMSLTDNTKLPEWLYFDIDAPRDLTKLRDGLDDAELYRQRQSREVDLMIKDNDAPRGFRFVRATADAFYNKHIVGQRVFHVISEAVYADGHIDVCHSCWGNMKKKSAPSNSIANREDYGRRKVIAKDGTSVTVELSDLEKLLVALNRSYMIVAKAVGGHRSRLRGCMITFPQEAAIMKPRFFYGPPLLKAALEQVQLYVVGPNNYRTSLEAKALQQIDKRLRPDAIFNALQVMWFVPDDDVRDERVCYPPSRDAFLASADFEFYDDSDGRSRRRTLFRRGCSKQQGT